MRLAGASVGAAYFDVFGLQPTVGRFFRADENPPGTARRVVLSYGLWVRAFGGDSSVVQRTTRLSGIEYEIVGVAPRELEDPQLSGATYGAPELWRVSPAYLRRIWPRTARVAPTPRSRD
jgi:hypothetical protein